MIYTDAFAPLPYGLGDLELKVSRKRNDGKLKCVVKGCSHWLQPPSRKPKHKGEACPDHAIRVHSGGTYSYVDYQRNLIVDADYFAEQIRGHPFKVESHRFGQERSEDAVSWNVFRSLQRAGLLHKVAELCTGRSVPQEPRLFLWGLELTDDGVEVWDLLVRARERFESDLPVDRPKTEPDIALYLAGEYLLLIEAKFCSPNGVYVRDGKTKLFDLTIDQLVRIYQDPALQFLDYQQAARRNRIHYQLWRNLIFAEWMALHAALGTQGYHINLVREGQEQAMCHEMLTLIRSEYQDRFEQISWEQIYGIVDGHCPRLERLCTYLECKTERLRPAFKLNRSIH